MFGIRTALKRAALRARLGFWPPPLDGMQNYQRMQFLHDCILDMAPAGGAALEIGCYKAGSTIWMAKACARRGIEDITAVDLFTGSPGWNQQFDTFEEARRRLDTWGLKHVKLVRSHSADMVWARPLSVLHVDGDHRYEAVKADLAKFLPQLTPEGIAIVDDYDDLHPGVIQAVDEALQDKSLENARVNHRKEGYGSICLRRKRDQA